MDSEDKRGIRIVLLILMIPVLLIAADSILTALFFPDPPCVFCLEGDELERARERIQERVANP